MATLYIALKVCALLLVMLLPLGGPGKKKNGNFVEISAWAVNEKGELINLSENEHDHYPIK